MTTIDRATGSRRIHFHDEAAPVAGAVVPSVFVVVRHEDGRLLLVRRCDSGAWELPGGRVDVGESAVETAVRETAEETGLRIVVTGFAGIFSDPGHVVVSARGEARQQFAVLVRARAVGGDLAADLVETSEAAWVPVEDLSGLAMEVPVRLWIDSVLDAGAEPHVG
ncbi:NUDIX hydrolase [Trujillonella endophytica]|uniref:ADP-ribose pyrophosphatase YjhB, NUDIX family n=1 Tax=Trujillonella endophytica TaxID=673521 RepID=A0A1H8QMY7_9ACTN|nr:NUDIX domain-containing protein [Trujillella endophytica]SEO55562.1 ADP-ribose pyrophosphatase YjhB, NUDIX family [Trujillella endophytica]